MSAVREMARAFAPATVANLGPGFDVLGLALESAGDTVTARVASDRAAGVRITAIRGAEGLPLDAAANTAGIAARRTLEIAGIDFGVDLEIEKGLPVGSGLGSSAASAAAAAYAVNLCLGGPLRKTQLVEACLDAEAAVAGRHADNVAPALLGGLVLVRRVDPLDLVRLPVPEGLFVVVVTPQFELATKRARAALPADVPLATAVRNTANLGALISAFASGDLGLLGRALEDDIVVPARAPLIPGCDAAMRGALRAGALGASISGGGPSVFALCHARGVTPRVADAMVAAFSDAGFDSDVLMSSADCPGARRL